MIKVVGGCKLFDIRKQLQRLVARGSQMALKLMAYQLHIKQKMIRQILREDFAKRKIWP
jgi:DNA-binding CsgD family transcriptional regulator